MCQVEHASFEAGGGGGGADAADADDGGAAEQARAELHAQVADI
eukprot:COSAG01_NODE_17425_length_1152_cov_2.063628_3_plen_43_part_01